MHWYPHSCPDCRGDMYEDTQDPNWVACLMCAREVRRADLLRLDIREAPIRLVPNRELQLDRAA